jgi:hypothetical protein
LTEVKARQIAENNPNLGIDCLQTGTPGNVHYNFFAFTGPKKKEFCAYLNENQYIFSES